MTKLLSLIEFVTHLEYHDQLNPKIWEGDTLRPDVRTALDKIVRDFVDFLKMDASKITDIVITGSNCNYNYSDLSDIDIHVIADFDPASMNSAGVTTADAFDALKTLYNDQRHITIHGYPIEVYVQPTSEHFTSNAGVFSLKNMRWIQHPVRQIVNLHDREIRRKADPIMKKIDKIVNGHVNDQAVIKQVKAKIKQMRNAGLQAGGEFGIENLAFKVVRNTGYLDKLSSYTKALKDANLSLK